VSCTICVRAHPPPEKQTWHSQCSQAQYTGRDGRVFSSIGVYAKIFVKVAKVARVAKVAKVASD
jgi:hypothetical protein